MQTQKGEAGYILFGIATGIVIMSIFMVAAVPYWQKVVQREREQELIFRGYQYIRAVELYQQKFPGAFPPNVDVLLEQKFLRNTYKDPLTGEDFKIIRQLSPEMRIGANQQSNAQQSNTGLSNINRSQAQMSSPGGNSLSNQTGAIRSATNERLNSKFGSSTNDQGFGGIVGVASTSHEKPFYEIPGKEKYSDWLFVLGAQPAMPGMTATGPFHNLTTGIQGAGTAAIIPPPPGKLRFSVGAQPQQPVTNQPGSNDPGSAPQPMPPGAPPFQPATGERQGMYNQTQRQGPTRLPQEEGLY